MFDCAEAELTDSPDGPRKSATISAVGMTAATSTSLSGYVGAIRVNFGAARTVRIGWRTLNPQCS